MLDTNTTCFGFAATKAELLELLSKTHKREAVVRREEEESYKATRPSVVAHANRSPETLKERATGDDDEVPPLPPDVLLFGISS
jgi:hypothetical protein